MYTGMPPSGHYLNFNFEGSYKPSLAQLTVTKTATL